MEINSYGLFAFHTVEWFMSSSEVVESISLWILSQVMNFLIDKN